MAASGIRLSLSSLLPMQFACKLLHSSPPAPFFAVRLSVCIHPKPATTVGANPSHIPLFALTSHINGGIHMQRMFFLPYSQKPLRLQRTGRRAKSCLLHIQNPLSDDKVCLHSNAATQHEALDSSESSRSRQSPLSIYLLSGFSVPLHQTQTIGYPSLQRLAPIAWREKVRSWSMFTSCSSI